LDGRRRRRIGGQERESERCLTHTIEGSMAEVTREKAGRARTVWNSTLGNPKEKKKRVEFKFGHWGKLHPFQPLAGAAKTDVNPLPRQKRREKGRKLLGE